MALRDWRWPQWTLLFGGIIFVALLGLVIYALLQPKAFTPTAPTPTTPGISGELPTPTEGPPSFPASPVESVPLGQIQGQFDDAPDLVARGGLTTVTQVTDIPVNFVNLAPNGSDISYYDPETNRFYRADQNGVLTKIGDQVFADVQTVSWAPNGNDAILEFPDGRNVRYNFDGGDQIAYPSHWTEFDFSPTSEQIAFKSLALDEDQRWLAVADNVGGSTKLVEHLGSNADIVDVDWAPNNQVVGTFSEPDDLNTSSLYFIGFNGENFPLSKLHGLNFEGSWTPDGRSMVYSVMHPDSNFLPQLWMVDGVGTDMGANRRPIALSTWSWKCTYKDSSTAYCGVPSYLPRGAGLIPNVADDIPDQLYQVNLTTGATQRLAIPQDSLNVQDITINEDGSSLYIHDRFTDSVKRIDL